MTILFKMEESSKIFLTNQGKKFLLNLRDNIPNIPYPNYWDLIGGGLEKDESPLECIKRECLEEIGYTPKNILFIETIEVPRHYLNPKDCRVHVFTGKIYKQIREINLQEGIDINYFSFEELKEIKFPYLWLDFIIKNKERLEL